MNGEIETLTLPREYSLGRITVYSFSERGPTKLLDARGTIEVPRGARLFLDLSQEVCDDLHRIHIVPARLLENGVSFSEKNLDKTDFRELFPLRPKSLAITFCGGLQMEQLRDLGELRSLEHLSLDRTPLENPDFSWLPQFPNLKMLLLSGTGADDSFVQYLSGLRRLEELHLAYCKLSDRGVQAIWRSASLRVVDFGKCPIGDRALEDVGCCSALKTLKVPDTRISDRGVEIIVAEALGAGQQLNSLTLRSCRITDMSLVRLASLRSLTFIDLYGTEVTAEGAFFLKGSLPECRIFAGREKGGGPKLWHVEDPESA
jgi:hypothetical protein